MVVNFSLFSCLAWLHFAFLGQIPGLLEVSSCMLAECLLNVVLCGQHTRGRGVAVLHKGRSLTTHAGHGWSSTRRVWGQERGQELGWGKLPTGYRTWGTEGKVMEDQRQTEMGMWAGALEAHLSQLESWLWLAAISRMSSISSSMRNGCCEVGSSSGQE